MDLILDVRERIGARLFVVGDVKQGIYRFRGAEGNAFIELDDRFGERALPAPRTYNLTRNFRSGEQLLDSMHPWFTEWGSRELLPYGPVTDCGRASGTRTAARLRRIERIAAKDFAEEAASTVERWQTLEPDDSIGILCRENWQASPYRRRPQARAVV